MGSDLPSAIVAELERATGSTVRSARSVAGGDIARACRVELADGARLFVKLHRDGARMFPTEARGLQWLRDANAIRIPVVVQIVLRKPTLVTDAQVRRQIEQLNLDFRKRNPDVAKLPAAFRALAAEESLHPS